MQGDRTGFNPEIPEKGQDFFAGISIEIGEPLADLPLPHHLSIPHKYQTEASRNRKIWKGINRT
jgi:hypothetical protein